MIPRLYHDAPLADGSAAALTSDQAHYLRVVLRRESGAELRLFNARDGEFAARLVEIGKKSAIAAIEARTRAPEEEPDIALLFAPVKRPAVETIIQKGAELGVRAFVPVLTDRTNAERVRVDRLRSIALEAAEQSGRLSVPEVQEPARLAELLLHWDRSRTLFYCDEGRDDPLKEGGEPSERAPPLIDAAKASGRTAALLIGPEGGFSPDERGWLRGVDFVKPVSLGPRILRADTAAIVALALWQAIAGNLQDRF